VKNEQSIRHQRIQASTEKTRKYDRVSGLAPKKGPGLPDGQVKVQILHTKDRADRATTPPREKGQRFPPGGRPTLTTFAKVQGAGVQKEKNKWHET